MSMIFQNNELIMVSHTDKKFNRIDEKTLAELSAQMKKVSETMKQMEEQFAKMPPKQRAMMEKMMKGKMPGMPGKSAIPTIRVEATGQGRWKSYSCKNYTIHYNDRRREEICAAPPNEVKGADEVLQAIGNMREFQKKLTDAMPQFTSSNVFAQQIEAMNQIDGFAVHRQEYVRDVKQNEIYLSSAKQESVSENLFSPPKGYKEEKFMAGRGGSK